MLANAVCILSEDRFLGRIGWLRPPPPADFGPRDYSFKITAMSFVNQTRKPVRGQSPRPDI